MKEASYSWVGVRRGPAIPLCPLLALPSLSWFHGQEQRQASTVRSTHPEGKASRSHGSLLKSKGTTFSQSLSTLSLILIGPDWVTSPLLNQSM